MRRSIALLLLASCDASPPKATMQPPMMIKGGNEVSQVQPYRGPAAAVIAGGRAARARRGAVEIWDLTKQLVASTLPVPEPEVALAADGDTIVIVANDRAARQVRVVRVPPTGAPTSLTGTSLAARFERVIATPSSLYVADRTGVYRYKLGAALALAKVTPWAADELATCIAFGDGVAFVQRGAIVTVDAADTVTTHPMKASIVHLAPAGAGRVWATTASAVQLIELASAKVLHELALPRAYHLAGAPDAAAVLSVESKGGAWSKLVLTAVGADGAVRWRKDLPVPAAQLARVAAGGGHVAVIADDQLVAFALADGAAVVP